VSEPLSACRRPRTDAEHRRPREAAAGCCPVVHRMTAAVSRARQAAPPGVSARPWACRKPTTGAEHRQRPAALSALSEEMAELQPGVRAAPGGQRQAACAEEPPPAVRVARAVRPAAQARRVRPDAAAARLRLHHGTAHHAAPRDHARAALSARGPLPGLPACCRRQQPAPSKWWRTRRAYSRLAPDT
jgi:hypothetical protein